MTLPIGTKVVHHYKRYAKGMCTGNALWLDGKTGVVVVQTAFGYGIKFDHYDSRMHHLAFMVEDGHGYWVSKELVFPIYENESIEDLL